MDSAQSAVAFDDTVTTAFSEGLTLWRAIGTVSSQGLTLWSAVGTISSQGLALWSANGTISSQGLTLWSTVRTILSDQAFFFQAIIATFGNGLAEHRVGGFHLRRGLVSSWQRESSAGQHREGKAKQ